MTKSSSGSRVGSRGPGSPARAGLGRMPVVGALLIVGIGGSVLMVSMLGGAGPGACKPLRQHTVLMIDKSHRMAPDDGRWMDLPPA